MQDAFSKYHPAVNFIFFLGAIGFGVVFQHPAYLLAGCLCGALYYLLLKGKKGVRMLLALLPVFVVVTAMNPLFNTQGSHVLFRLFGRPYTLEALLYGAAVAAILVQMVLWFGCYNVVLTSDKFVCLFGSLAPSLSLLLVMIFRMVPNLVRKAEQILLARQSIGKGMVGAGKKEKLQGGMTVLSALTTWALEGSIVTADSMRSRGYGCGRRSSFQLYRFGFADVILTAGILLGITAVILTAVSGGTAAEYTPQLRFAPLTGLQAAGFGVYCLYLLIPSILHGKEALVWHISRSKI